MNATDRFAAATIAFAITLLLGGCAERRGALEAGVTGNQRTAEQSGRSEDEDIYISMLRARDIYPHLTDREVLGVAEEVCAMFASGAGKADVYTYAANMALDAGYAMSYQDPDVVLNLAVQNFCPQYRSGNTY